MKQGKGKIMVEEGFIYEGEVSEGYPHGYGKQYHPEKMEGYEGNWNQGEFEGRGKITTEDGTTYEGTFANGLLEGPVTVTFTNGMQKQAICKKGVPRLEE